MKVILHIAFYGIICCLLWSCDKDDSAPMADSVRQGYIAEQEDAMIRSYLLGHNLQAQKDPSGLYYKILHFGDSTSYITPNSIPYVIYNRRLLNDKLIDASLGVTNFDGRPLKDHIIGWQIGLSRISKGGKILMFIPSRLAFGNVAVGSIPPNSVLISEVELVDFK